MQRGKKGTEKERRNKGLPRCGGERWSLASKFPVLATKG